MSDRKADTFTIMAPERKERPLLVNLVVRLIKEKPLGTAGGVIVLTVFFVGIAAPLLSPYPPNETHADSVLSPPTSAFILGTDNLGRDLLTRTVYGARTSMSVGLFVPCIAIIVALLIGTTSGHLGGKYDLIVQRFVDGWMCVPQFLMLLTMMSVVGPGILQVIVVLGINYGIVISRIVRSAVLNIKENMYMQAAEVIGCSSWETLTRHILPNIMSTVIVLFTMYMSTAILSEAGLSFLGLGIPPPTPTWGGMLSTDGRKHMLIAPWMAFWPGLALSVSVYGISMLGDAVRDILDPRLRGGIGRY